MLERTLLILNAARNNCFFMLSYASLISLASVIERTQTSVAGDENSMLKYLQRPYKRMEVLL